MKRIKRFMAGLLALVMIMTNVCANVTTAWAAEGGPGSAAPSGGDTVEISLHIGDSLYLPALVDGAEGEWKYDQAVEEYVNISSDGLTLTGKSRGTFTVTFTGENASGLLPPETVQEATAQDATPSNASKTFRIRVLPESSGDLGDFLVAMEVYQVTGDTTRLVVRTGKDGEILEKGEGKLIKDGEYRVVLQFREPEQQAMLFRAATPEELAAAGISEYPAGEWMYVLLGDIDASKIGQDQEENGNVKVVNGGKALLFRFQTDASGNHITYCDITFTGNLDENANLENIQIVHGSSGGTIEFEPETAPSVEKEAGQYRVDADAGQHRIPYTITVANPESGTTISSITVTDTIQTPGAKLAAGTVKVDETPVSDHMITVKEDGSGFRIKDYPANLAPGGKIVITYEVDVNDLLEKLGSSAAAFNVNNTVEVWPDGAAEPLTDDESSQVYLGKLTKSGGYPITWYDNPELIYWWITAYDPYLGLDDEEANRVLSDVMPKQLTFDDIVGIQFMTSVKGDDGNLLSYPFFKEHTDKNYTIDRLVNKGVLSYGEKDGHTVLEFNLVKLAELSKEIGMNLFETEDHKNLEIGIYTKPKGNGYYENRAKITLPSEIVERDAEAHINIGPAGVDVEKTGKLNSDGRKLDYTVTMNVGAHIGDGTGYFNGQAMIHDVMSIITPGKDYLFDVSKGIEIKSVVATYKDGDEDKTWEFTKNNADPEHTYELYKVHQIGYGTDNEWLSADTVQANSISSETCLFFNPQETEIEWWNNRVEGRWPEELSKHDVTVTINYTIDPDYVYFIDVAENGSWVKKAYNGCDTLAAYLEKEEDVVVHNTVTGSVKGSSDADYFDLNLTKPLKKDGELKTDPAISQKRAAYTVTFHNGLDNDSAIPSGAGNIVFKDHFDSSMVYVSGSLKAQLKKTTGELTEFTYIGDQDTLVQGGVITASWSDFKTADGQTLQKNFNAQTAHYQYIFTYELEPGKSFPQKVDGEYAARIPIDNEAWLEFDGGALAHVNEELQFPTGVLTKGAVIDGDKVAFYVEINEKSQDLSAGELIVKDDPSNHDDLEIVADSITVAAYTDGGMKLLVKGTDYTEEMGTDGAFMLHLPDETHLRVRYEYALKPEAKSKAKVSITNKVNIEGKSLLEDGQTWEFETSSIGADFGGSKASLTLKKVRKDTREPVPGAQFILYAPNSNGTTNDEAIEAAGAINKESIFYNGSMLRPVAVYKTGPEGKAQIDWELLSTGVAYALAEYQVPGGYRKLKDPVIFRIERIAGNEVVKVLNGANGLIGTEGNVLTVANEYGVEFIPAVKKEIAGDPVPADQKENFKFKLSAVSGNPAGGAAYNGAEIADGLTDVGEITVQGAGTGSFGPIAFTEPGTYSFEITEMKGENPSYSYDEAVWTLTVTVEDRNGELAVTGHTYAAADGAAGNEEAAKFTNIYTPAPVKTAIGVKKTVTGDVPAGTDPEFTFTLSQPEPAAEGVELPGSLKVTAKAGESKNFGDIEFTKAGTYVFEVTETAGTQRGYTYDGSKYSISITVEDQAGQLTVTKREVTKQLPDGAAETPVQLVAGETLTVEFTNQYKADETAYAPKVVKTVAGDTAPKAETFTFTLEADSANPEGAVLSESETAARTTVTGTETGSFEASFDEITFKKAGTYKFTIKEDAGSEKGWIYDEAVWTLTVTVEDQNGKLAVTGHTYASSVDAAENNEAAAFTNTYTPESATAVIGVSKTVTGDVPARTDPEFTFTISQPEAAEGAQLPDQTTVAARAGGEANFDEITFTKAGIYVFEVKETAGTQPGYTYDGTVYKIEITVEDKDGELAVTKREVTRQTPGAAADTVFQSEPETATVVGFTNQYKASEVGYAPQVVKTVAGDTAPKAETFAFTLEADSANPEGAVLSESEAAARTTVAGAGTASFDTITFKKVGTYKFTIKEEPGTEKGWTYDETVWTLTVQVEDQDGVLTVTGHTYAGSGDAAGNDEAAAFTNTYTAPGKLTIRKTVSGSTGEKERDFNFTVTLTDAEGQPLAGSYPYSGSSSEQDVAAPAGGTVENGSLSVTLRHGQQITIEDLPAGTRYTVSEAEANADGYTTTAAVDGAAQTGEASGVVKAAATSTVEYVNSREGGGTTPGDEPGNEPTPGGNPTPERTEIPENTTPTGGTPPIENLSDEPTPLSDFRHTETIEDEDLPLAFMAPVTGDEMPTGAAALFGLIALGMMGVFGILAFRKEEDEA